MNRYALPLVCGALALSGCDQRDWRGWVYPNKADLTRDIPLGSFESLDQCRTSAQMVLYWKSSTDENGDEIEGDYECGLNCKLEPGEGGLNVCEKTGAKPLGHTSM